MMHSVTQQAQMKKHRHKVKGEQSNVMQQANDMQHTSVRMDAAYMTDSC